MESPDLNEREQALWRSFTQMSRHLAGAIDSQLSADAGISSAEFEVLQALASSPAEQARARDLASALTWEKSRVSHLVKRMVARDLVDRVKCETDRRGSWVKIATTGVDALNRARPGYAAVVRKEFVALLTPAEKAAFAATARKVADSSKGPEPTRQ